MSHAAYHCPNCGHHNRMGVLICENCGQSIFDTNFTSTRIVERVSAEALSLAPMQTTFRVAEATIVLQIDGAKPITIQAHKPIILGRGNNNSPRSPDVDLTAFKAFEKGVSCRHALLGYSDGKLMIADLGSANGTFVTGQRLVPHRSYPLQNGDEVRLANLGFRVEVAD